MCDDFSAIAQRLNGLGHPILWWEIPHRRAPEPGEPTVPLPGGGVAPQALVAFVADESRRVAGALRTRMEALLETARERRRSPP